MTYAGSNGYLEVVRWLHENRSEGCSEEAFKFAAREGSLEIVKWLDANGFKSNLCDAVEIATTWGQLHVIKWLLSTTDNEKEYESYAGFTLEVVKKRSDYP
ncbi:putative ankyrin repeat protein L63 [Phytophthora citrophthora]|uniref:Ankyrin repeat protein L63 n=1 Tax=Phytophthora citrophthora TaxID=4793 RepID=A0AAD9LCI5_9STRA|nr:putative ankyrin repeat protein L63 [Phytophthora citrophthora]